MAEHHRLEVAEHHRLEVAEHHRRSHSASLKSIGLMTSIMVRRTIHSGWVSSASTPRR
ncbi:Uncharacterised protein [Mycobacteroides abscessus subsp. abscessus]|nr:Uncharacterised protein [Mycobacteroides abscessus subsp. abscessus]